MRKLKRVLIALSLVLLWSSCKDKWLEVKPDVTLVVPDKISDYQALLDNTGQVFNISQSSGMGEIASGDFYITDATFSGLFNVQERSAYTWAPTENFYAKEPALDWASGYRRILTTNVVLDGIQKIIPKTDEMADWNNVKGSALFYRSFDFYCLAEEYCRPYVAATADSEAGLPLRLDINVNQQVQRSTLQQTYDRLIEDLKQSVSLLGTTPFVKTRPSKQAAYALLSRVFLTMERYDMASLYADSALHIQPGLIDFATVNASAAYPLTKFNPEVIFHSTFNYGIFTSPRPITNPELYSSYSNDDFRKTVFYRSIAGGFIFKGNYSGDRLLFGGLSTNELYLIRAESNARAGKFAAAMKDLNFLLSKRWKGTYRELIANNENDALSLILNERRKELAFRGLRWSDLRRLNKDPRFAVTIIRTVNGKNYLLPPNSMRYVFPIDNQEVQLNGTLQLER